MPRRLVASIVVLGAGLVYGALAGCGNPAATRDAHDPPGDVAAEPRDAASSLDAPDVSPVDASPFDASPGVPDLQFVAAEMANTFVVTADQFAADDCAVMEGCVGGAGTRILLRFDTVTANRGSSDLIVGVPPPPGESNAVFQWSPCHMHHHVANYASYELIDTTGTVLTARKQSFCLEDGEQVQPGSTPTGYSCLNQGISHGWADVYSRYLPCQWIDVTGLPSGAYTLRIVVNPLHTITESNYDNNVFTASVQF